MEDRKQPRNVPATADGITQGDSIARRRAILKRIAGASAAAGAAATPLGALAGGTVKPWCKNKTNGTNVHATVSAVASVILSANSNSQKFGYPGSHFTGSPPAGRFCDIFTSCTSTSKDSKNVAYGAAGCLLNKTCSNILTYQTTTQEYHWLVAYCNALAGQGSTFPYTTTNVLNYYAAQNASALAFFTNFMESGS